MFVKYGFLYKNITKQIDSEEITILITSLHTRLHFPNDLNILVMQRFFCSMLGWT